MKKFTGFTLAEVLITLTIIGVISVLTVPSLIGNINNQTSAAKLRKAYASINQAIGMQMAEDGGNAADTLPISKNGTTMETGIMSILARFISGTPLSSTAFKGADGIIYATASQPSTAGTTYGAISPNPVGYMFIITRSQDDKNLSTSTGNLITLNADKDLEPGKAFEVPLFQDGIAFPLTGTAYSNWGTGETGALAASYRVINNKLGQKNN